ncbi:hypothetical protein LZC95_02330 [Pendulispora brunnea]|uniref:Collagen-like protein n=1 Tax=Pendulispora brunnea TaxID=2905690 RepID=A0ABZ2KFK3_9BACT
MAAILLLGVTGCGIPAIDASKVQRLEVVSYEGAYFCPTGENKLAVQAKMSDGSVRSTNASDRSDQFDAAELVWAVSPSMGQVVSNKLDVAFVPNDDITPALEKNVTLDVAMEKNRAAKGTIELTPNFACHQGAWFSAEAGAEGESGSMSYSLFSSFSSRGRSGGNGRSGRSGRDATPVVARVKLVETKRGTLAAVRVMRLSDDYTVTYFVDPKAGRITIMNRGGQGGKGGSGEDGQRGDSGGTCRRGGDGGNGGNGGDGGDGGDGGAVTVYIDASHPELANLIRVDNRGGDAGRGGYRGSGGYGGFGGSDSKKKCNPSDGRTGESGISGSDGRSGRPGPAPQFLMAEPESFTF